MNMSSIGSISNSYASNINPFTNGNGAGNQPISHKGHHLQGEGGLMQGIMQALQSLGINMPTNASGAGKAGAGKNHHDGDDGINAMTAASGNASNPMQALHTFMHDLYQAINQQAGVNASASSNKGITVNGSPSAYSDFSTKLQNLISSLNNTSGSHNVGTTLQNDFNNLIAGIGGNSAVTAKNPSSVNLQSFLKQLETNLNTLGTQQMGVGSLLTAKA